MRPRRSSQPAAMPSARHGPGQSIGCSRPGRAAPPARPASLHPPDRAAARRAAQAAEPRQGREAEGHPDLRGARCRRQGRHHQALYRAHEPARRAHRSARQADRRGDARSGTSSATRGICRRAARSCSSTEVGTTARWSSASWASAMKDELREFLRSAPEFERMLIRAGMQSAQVLLLEVSKEDRRAGSPAGSTIR